MPSPRVVARVITAIIEWLSEKYGVDNEDVISELRNLIGCGHENTY